MTPLVFARAAIFFFMAFACGVSFSSCVGWP